MNQCTLTPRDTISIPEYDECRARVVGTTIDEKTLLSTDYFNNFNEVVMLLGMVGDMPEMLDDIRAWKFLTYEEHFRESGLSIGPLAIEAYDQSPPDVRDRFEKLVDEIRATIDEARRILEPPTNEDELNRLKLSTTEYSRHLQGLIAAGSGIVHAADTKVDQTMIDQMF